MAYFEFRSGIFQYLSVPPEAFFGKWLWPVKIHRFLRFEDRGASRSITCLQNVLFLFYSVLMSISGAPAVLRLARGNLTRDESRVPETFEIVRAAMADAPLNEIMPASPGDHAAALGFALAWAVAATKSKPGGGVIFWAAPEQDFFEDGLPNAEGLAQFGIELDQLLMVRANSQMDALWATEQALTTPQTTAICAISPSKKSLNLTATRRLLLTAEKHKTRCILLRLDCAGASAAWSRWTIRAAPSEGIGRELGVPSFNAYLARNRTGPSNFSFNFQWDIHSHAFRERQGGRDVSMDGAVAFASADRPVDTNEHAVA